MGSIPTAEKPIQDEIWKHGDFSLVSSDHVEFKIDSRSLVGVESAFRDANELSTEKHPQSVALTDGTIETAAVIRIVLDILVKGSLSPREPPSPTTFEADTRLYHSVVLFCIKYSFEAPLQVFLCAVRDLLQGEKIQPIAVFIIGAAADCEKTCLASFATPSVERAMNPSYYDSLSHWLRYMFSSPDCFGIRQLPVWIWKLVPVEYMWALGQAWSHSVPPGELATTFEKKIAEAKQKVFDLLEDTLTHSAGYWLARDERTVHNPRF